MTQRWTSASSSAGVQYVRRVRLDGAADMGRYPFSLPAVAWLADASGLELAPGVTFLVGENGSGKSTLVEALAVACGFNPEGGSQSFRFATRATESGLGDHLVLSWGGRKPRTGFFLRAESYYNVATEIERLDADPYSPPLLPAYGGISPHDRSHGESFLDLVLHRFRPGRLVPRDAHGFTPRVGEDDAMKGPFITPSATKGPFISPGPGRAHVNKPGSRDGP